MWRRRLALAGLSLGVVGLLATWLVGSFLIAPCPRVIGDPPDGLDVEDVEFSTERGNRVRGWFSPGDPDGPGVVLLHPLRGDRRTMVARARMLSERGVATLMIDLQAHGESEGEHLTFGWLEAADAAAAVHYMRRRLPGRAIGVIGVSLGGAAAVAAGPVDADAFVLEMVYPTLPEAVANRVGIFTGSLGAALLTPLLTGQCSLRLGFSASELSPIEGLADTTAPVLLIGGDDDRHTPPKETLRMFDAAAGPKLLWMVPGAAHEDFFARDPAGYRRHVLPFLDANLRAESVLSPDARG